MLPRSLIGPIVLGFLALNLLGQALPLYTDYLWFQEVTFPRSSPRSCGTRWPWGSPAA